MRPGEVQAGAFSMPAGRMISSSSSRAHVASDRRDVPSHGWTIPSRTPEHVSDNQKALLIARVNELSAG